MDAKQLCEQNKLVKMYAGSIAYGTNLPTSDVDLRGLFCADPINIRTPFFPVREYDDKSEEDTKYYELTHFMKLCLDCNPNIIEQLWTDDSDIVYRTPAYDKLRENRSKLLSSKIAFTTSGYAHSQLNRLKGHHKWINQPQPEQPPVPKDYVSMVQNLQDEKMFKFDVDCWNKGHILVPYGNEIYGVYVSHKHSIYDKRGNLNTKFDGDREDLGQPIIIIKYNKDVYKEFKEKHRCYWQWKDNRNEARSELEEHFGYDTKHAMHLVRLLRIGYEVLTTGEIHVKRPDAAELLEIRGGSWSYEKLIKYSDDMDIKIKDLYKKTSLRTKPDIHFAANLLMEVQDLIWK